ncbi:MAG TPA: hypothetical protein VJQ44_18855 [Gemmatimonadales bacterium]|nr:hypothetical protein [Gemmatimonadales bacterium]
MESHGWMPIVIVHDAPTHHVTVHPDTAPPQATATPPPRAAWEQRVGTALRRPDGSFDLLLMAVPLRGRLRMRPPQPGELPDPTAPREG